MPEQQRAHLYEERVTLWSADTFEVALELAEQEANAYAAEAGERLDLLQAFQLFDEINLPSQGLEVFSLLRESDLSADDYIDSFFDTGDERERTVDLSASP